MGNATTLNYAGVFLSCFTDDGVSCTDMVKDHTLTYVYNGELEVDVEGVKHIIGGNECVFIRRDHRVKLEKRACGGDQYKGISLTFQRSFLREFYGGLDKKELPGNMAADPAITLVKIGARPDIVSLFQSLTPYFDSNVKPSPEIIRLKEQEGIYALLHTAADFYPLLFDFTEPWKIDIMEFMNENYMYDLSMEELASFTGRSLATFKRDFARISDIPPRKWLIQRRLQAAYDKIHYEGRKAGDIYLEVGFKDISHFYHAYRKQYGCSPVK